MPSGADRVVERLKRILDERKRVEADVRPARVVGRNPDGTARLQRLDGECVSRGGAGGHLGEIVNELPGLVNRQGTAGVPLVSRRDTVALLIVERLEPRELLRGATGQAVDVIGKGFTATTRFDFLLPTAKEINPSIEIASQTFVDEELIRLVVNATDDAELAEQLPLAYGDPARGL